MSILELLGVKPTISRFAARIVRALPEDERPDWSFDEARGLLKGPGGSEMSLHNMFLEYGNASVSGRAALVEKYASLAQSSASEIPDLWVAAAKNLFPVVRSQLVDSTVRIRLRADGGTYDPVVFPLAGDMQIRLMYDFGRYMSYVTMEKLRTWGQTEPEVLARAIANLGRLESPTWVEDGQGVFRLESSESFRESMLLLDSVVDNLPFAANAVLMPCNRGVLLASDGRSEPAIHAMLVEAERHLESPWPMSALMCRRTTSGWAAVEPPAASANLAHGLAIRHLAENYAAQRDALNPLHEAQGNDVYVAEYNVLTMDGTWQSYCVWSESVRALLPVTDWVAVLPEGESADHIRVPWNDVVRVSGGRMQVTEENPPRFLVESFPDADEWAELVALQLAS